MKASINTLFAILSLLYLVLMTYTESMGQYGNEWIKEGQKYYKISVAQTGIYGIPSIQLRSMFPEAVSAPNRLQLFHRGVEQAIYIRGGEDGVFDASDSLYFYGQMNDGALDTLTYEKGRQLNKYYNLYSDTTAYFLTFSPLQEGKRMQKYLLTTAPEKASFHQEEILINFSNAYYNGGIYGQGDKVHLSTGDEGEGWGQSLPSIGTRKFLINNLVGSSVDLELRVMGSGTSEHRVEVLVGSPTNPDTILQFPVFYDRQASTLVGSIPNKFIINGELTLTCRGFSNIGIAYLKVLYYQMPILQGENAKQFNFYSHTRENHEINIQNVPSPNFLLFDVSSSSSTSLLETSWINNILTATAPFHGTHKKLWLVNKQGTLGVYDFKQVNLYTDYLKDSADFIIVSHRKLMGPSMIYADYRKSIAGGNHKVLIADIENLYNQFAYGERNPVAVKSFCKYLIENGNPNFKTGGNAKFLLIIGKGLNINYYTGGAQTYRKDPNYYISRKLESLVPPFGFPGSDVLFTTGLGGKEGDVPALATGRIPALDSVQVISYLNKVKDHEQQKPDLWRKHLLHISGGDNVAQGKQLKALMENVKPKAEGAVFGGKVVKHIAKLETVRNREDRALIQEITEEVNKGVSYLTYLGHAGARGTEVDFGKPSEEIYNYSNEGKYPMLFMNGCFIANVFIENPYADHWLFPEKKGGILYFGHVHNGYVNEFNSYLHHFYRENFSIAANKDKSIGEIIPNVVNEYLNISGSTPVTRAHSQQMLLLGDPALKMYKPSLADLKYENAFVKSFSSQPVSALSDSFQVAIVASNLGILSADSFAISIVRTIGGNNLMSYPPQKFKTILYKDTLYFTIKSKDVATYGLNTFEIKLDAFDSIPELSETNNTGSFQFFMPFTSVNAVYPKEYSIVSKSSINLIAQSTDLMEGEREFYFELDTTFHFNSPFKKAIIKSGNSIAKTDKISLLEGTSYDSLVYYWRVRHKDPSDGDTVWGESSFIYINGSPPGWSQSRYGQFRKDIISGGFINPVTERLQFSPSSFKFKIETMGVRANTDNYGPYTKFKIENSLLIENGNGRCPSPYTGIIAVAINNYTGDFYRPQWVVDTCWSSYKAQYIMTLFKFGDPANATAAANLIKYLDDIPENYYVLLFNIGNANFHLWSQTLRQKIKSTFNAQLVDDLTEGNGYILFAQKNNSTGPISERTAAYLEPIAVDGQINYTSPHASITSTLIGPANEWGAVYRKFSQKDTSDYFILDLYGVDSKGKETFIYSVPKDSFPITDVDAKKYPYVTLKATVYDSTFRTPVDFRKWQVIFKGVPEGTLNPAFIGHEQYKKQTKYEGDTLTLRYAFENISDFDFADTLKVRMKLQKEGGVIDSLVNLKILKSGDQIIFDYKITTLGLKGNNLLQAFVNPYIQLEEYYNNNIIEVPFEVLGDKTSPLVDVSFDGIHIIDGDIVSPSPLINIRLLDENKYLKYNSKDTASVQIFLVGPCSNCSATVPVKLTGNPDIRYIGNGGKGNNFYVEFNPQKLPDGKYTLMVKGKDVSGNGFTQPYQITFEVINQSTITHFYPYPNPFSTNTKFVFTLTGNEIPEDLKIQIMTVTGRVVREITKAELGSIRIGTNVSQFSWDGTDEFGDKLANGVYLFRVKIKNAGDNFKRRETAADKAFKKDFGKLYIMR